ncbi:MAG: DinB family protein [Anaerolineae bacterium]|nr:DinB family protein [Gloeobacterales cyanobacterium ES-bin-313]
MHSRFDEFRRLPLGQQLEHLIDTPERYLEYAALSRATVPAVTAIVHDLKDRFAEVSGNMTAKQFCGALVADIMRRHNHVLVQERGRVPGGYFTFGTVWSPTPVPVTFEVLLSALDQMPQQIAVAIAQLSDGQWGALPCGTGFSALEHTCHLRDLDTVYKERLEAILTLEAPVLPGVNGTLLAVEREYCKQDLNEALTNFRLGRGSLVEAFINVSEAHRKRYGLFDGVKRMTIDDLVRDIHQHDQTHLQELNELVAELLSGGA